MITKNDIELIREAGHFFNTSLLVVLPDLADGLTVLADRLEKELEEEQSRPCEICGTDHSKKFDREDFLRKAKKVADSTERQPIEKLKTAFIPYVGSISKPIPDISYIAEMASKINELVNRLNELEETK